MSKTKTTAELSLDVTLKRVRRALVALPGDYSTRIVSMLDRRDWVGVINIDAPDPASYECASRFHNDYTCYNMLRKFDSFPTDIRKDDRALEAFLQSEKPCKSVNEFFQQCLAAPYESGIPLEGQVTSILHRAQSIIARELGKFRITELVEVCGFTSGSSTRLPRKKGHPVFKLAESLHVTPACQNMLIAFIYSSPAWSQHMRDNVSFWPQDWVTVVPGSKFITVPKDSKIDRGINVEPEGNMFFQRGIGRMIGKRLRRIGIDLRDQGLNQKLASVASRCGLATIDLSQASDSIALALVEYLLPSDWFEWIDRTRSHYVTLPDGQLHKLEKVSSMGNGFTFELESLIFWALTVALVDEERQGPALGTVSVYGDDIICPAYVVPDLVRVFTHVGFQVNPRKSFWSGPFRESCGKHYFNGVDVTPIYVKEPIASLDRKFWWINTLREYDWELGPVADAFERELPARDRLYVPESFPNDSGIRCNTKPKWCRRRKLYKIRYLTKRSDKRKRHTDSEGLVYACMADAKVPVTVDGGKWVRRLTISPRWY